MQLAKRYAGIVSVGGLTILLIAAYFFDNLVHALRRHSNVGGDVYFQRVLLSMWLIPILFLVLAMGLLFLLWFVVYQENRNITILGLFIIIGIVVLFIPPLSYARWWHISIPYFLNWPGKDGWFLPGTSAFIVVIGLIGVVFSKEKSR
jgi:undecaprenyl pyrophosphate phosphatase UppP